MNTLDLNGFGVQEMDAKEMEVIDGGIIPVLALLVASTTMGMAAGYYAGKAYYYFTH